METNNINCLICKKSINKNAKNIYQEMTEYSKTPLINILNNIQKLEFLKETAGFSSGCTRCILKLNKYDLAIVTANKIRQEIILLFEESKELFRHNLTNVLKNQDDSISTVSNEGDFIGNIKIEIEKDYCTTETTNNLNPELEIDLNNDNISTNIKSENEMKLTKGGNLSIVQKKEKENLITDNLKYNSIRLPICKVCNKMFDKNSDLTDHRQTQEHLDIHNKNAKFECGECGKKFTKKYALECHLPIHMGVDEEYTAAPVRIAEYFCENCDFKCNLLAILNRHKQIHSNLKPFKCPCCNKRFAQSSSINRHLPVHTGEKRFQCDACGRQFNAHSSFRRHKLIHENKGEKHHECPNCGRKYAHRYNMDAHIKKKHSNINKKRNTLI